MILYIYHENLAPMGKGEKEKNMTTLENLVARIEELKIALNRESELYLKNYKNGFFADVDDMAVMWNKNISRIIESELIGIRTFVNADMVDIRGEMKLCGILEEIRESEKYRFIYLMPKKKGGNCWKSS